MKGKVLAVGPGARKKNGSRLKMDVSVGDTIIYAKYAGIEIKVDGDKYLILQESMDVLAIVS